MSLSLENRKRYCPLEMAMVDEHRCADCKYGYDLPDGTIVCKFFEKKRKSVEVGQCHKCLGTVYMKYGKIQCTGCGAEYEIEGRCPKCGKPLLYDGEEYYLYCSKCSFSCIYIYPVPAINVGTWCLYFLYTMLKGRMENLCLFVTIVSATLLNERGRY